MISCVLQYSTIDFRFFELNLKQLSKFDSEIIIPICNKLFSGEDENKNLIDQSYEIAKKYNAKIIPFEWQGPDKTTRYYHNLSRQIGTDYCNNDWVLFVDTDEIISDEFKDWFDDTKQLNYGGFWLSCYWYFRQPTYRSKTWEGAGLLTQKKYCSWNVNAPFERQQLFNKIPNFFHGHYSKILSKSIQPLVHHFSWVRTKEEMLAKVKNWGHNNDHGRDWESLVNEEFSRNFNGTDFVHGYEYDVVEDIFNLIK